MKTLHKLLRNELNFQFRHSLGGELSEELWIERKYVTSGKRPLGLVLSRSQEGHFAPIWEAIWTRANAR